jgi:putative oxidoreductase
MMLSIFDNKYVHAIARALIAGTYFLGGLALLSGEVPVGYAASKGIPAFATHAAFAIKLVGGLCIIIGFQTRLAALLLAVFTTATAFIFHFPTPEDPYTFGKEITMLGGLLLLVAVGSGALSVDARLGREGR